MREKFMKD